MRILDLKVWRDVRHLRGQMTAVTLLVVCGVAVFIMLRSMYGYLREARDEYYTDYAFAEVFAHAVRAPDAVAARLAGLSGIDRVDTRLVRDVLLDVPGLAEPATGRLVSLPDHGPPTLNRLYFESGHAPDPGRRDQVVVSAAFAQANGLRIGDGFAAVIGGRREWLTIVGTARSPEFIYEVSGVGTVFPDNRRFGAMWMSRSAMASAFDMQGAFNDVVATLAPGAVERAVLARIDAVLERYGGTGAYGRDRQLSHQFVDSEIEETQITASFFPALFLVITAFLIHTTLVRLVGLEREQIGLMKAFGYASRTIAGHYVKLALVPVLAGALAGVGLGGWLAARMARLYAAFFQFPDAPFQLNSGVVLTALAIALGTGIAGALAAARRVVRLAPAVAMAPPAPPAVHHGRLEHTPIWPLLGAAGRNVVRNVTRTRWRSAATSGGIALALGVLVTLLSMFDAIDVIAELQFEQAYRDDVTVFFDRPLDDRALGELRRLPGVLEVEGLRAVSARLTHRGIERRTALMGLDPGAELRRIVDTDRRRIPLPPDGLLLGRPLADALGVEPGDSLRVEVTEGRRPIATLAVAGLVDEVIGGEVHLEQATLRRLLGEGRLHSGARLRIDGLERERIYAELKAMPGIASVLVKQVLVDGFEATIEESFMIALSMTLLLGTALVSAIVYNQTRIALSERGRELASLRVLGFTRREVARMLLGEQALLVVAATPFGLALGWLLTLAIVSRFDTELFRLPVVAQPGTYVLSLGLIAVSAALSAWLVRRRLDRIDLVAVLKTRE
jgi:putative ABC transport system permease protein